MPSLPLLLLLMRLCLGLPTTPVMLQVVSRALRVEVLFPRTRLPFMLTRGLLVVGELTRLLPFRKEMRLLSGSTVPLCCCCWCWGCCGPCVGRKVGC